MGNFSVLSGWWFSTIFLDGEVSLQVCRGLLLYGLSSNILTTGADQGFLILLFLRPLQVLHRVAHQRSLLRLLWCGKVLPSSGRQHHSTPLEHSTEVQSDSDSSDEASSCVVFVLYRPPPPVRTSSPLPSNTRVVMANVLRAQNDATDPGEFLFVLGFL